MRGEQSRLLSIPPEIRLHIYSFLLYDGGDKWLAIRSKPASRERNTQQEPDTHTPQPDDKRQHAHLVAHGIRRTKYNVMEQTSMFHRRCYETTYSLARSSHAEMHTTFMTICRFVYAEAADALYGKHYFDFGHHIEAVVPFLADRTPHTRQMVRFISVYKRGPMPCLGSTSDKSEWSYMCRYLATTAAVKRLRVMVECGRPGRPWEGVQDLSESDVRLLTLIGHDCLEWVSDLAKVKNLDELDVVPVVKHLPEPKSASMVLYAALSASVAEGLVGFLRSEMMVPK